jgi:Phosphotransferase enzyme family
LRPFAGPAIGDVRAVFQVELTNGTSGVMRAYREDVPVPDWLVGCAADTTPAWLLSRAATLRYLAQQRYPAPRVIATRAGASIGQGAGWCTLLTSYIDGQLADPTPTTLSGMAGALGRLHLLSLANPVMAASETGKSWWYPAIAIPATLQQYAGLAQNLPPEW